MLRPFNTHHHLFCLSVLLLASCEPSSRQQPARQPTRPVAENQAPRSLDDVKPNEAIAAVPPEETLMRRALAAALRVSGTQDGSGVLLHDPSTNQYIALTAYHVVKDSKTLHVEVFDSATFPHAVKSTARAQIIGFSERLDLAILRLPTTHTKLASLPLASQAAPGKLVYSVGCSDGKQPTVLPERLLGDYRVRRPGHKLSSRMWKSEMPPNAGRSGGPLIDEDGNIWGIAIAASGRNGFYVHRNEIVVFLKDNGLDPLAAIPARNGGDTK